MNKKAMKAINFAIDLMVGDNKEIDRAKMVKSLKKDYKSWNQKKKTEFLALVNKAKESKD